MATSSFFAASLYRIRSNGGWDRYLAWVQIDRVELEVRTDSRRALELYRDSGFAIESIVRKDMKVDGIYHDAFRMSLLTTTVSTAA